MPGLVVRGREIQVPGITVVNWHDVPRYRLRIGVNHPDGRPAPGRRVLGSVIHTTKGIPGGKDHRPQFVKPGAGPAGGDDACARWWSTDPNPGGAHLVVDRDGTIACLADLADEVAFHAGHPNNDYTVGWEVYQDQDAGIWQASIDSLVIAAPFVLDLFSLPHQLHLPYLGGPVPRLDRPGGVDYRGAYGHRDCDRHRGQGDPGDIIIRALIDQAGFEAFDVSQNEDLECWKERQRRLNAVGCTPPLTVDGIPGPKTMRAWRDLGATTRNGYAKPMETP
jgi:hypothetical protein